MNFRAVQPDEALRCYRIHCEAVLMLLEKGVRQWLRPASFKVFEERVSDQVLFALEKSGEFLVIGTVHRPVKDEWGDVLESSNPIFFSTICRNPTSDGKGLGARWIQEALAKQPPNEPVYVDCVTGDGTLKRLYEDCGFQQVARRHIEYPTGAFELDLFVHKSRK